jgi:hypothetical protein
MKYIQSFGGETRDKELLGIPRHSWLDNMEVAVKEVDCKDLDLIHLAENRDRWQAAGSFGSHLVLGIALAERLFRDSALWD